MAQRASTIPAPKKTIKTGYVFIGVSLVLALITGVIFFNVVMGIARNASKPMPMKPVVVAKASIPAGQVIAVEHLTVAQWPEQYAPVGEVFESPDTLVGRVAKSEILVNEPVYNAKLVGGSSTGGLKVLIPKGLRAMTVAVTEVSGVGGFVKPGDRVDVVGTFKNLGDEGQRTQKSQIILQDVIVLAAAQQMTSKATVSSRRGADMTSENDTRDADKKDVDKDEKDAAEKKNEEALEDPAKIVASVTLALRPDQIEKLSLADETARIRLVLRSEDDHTYAHVTGITNHQLIGGAPAAPVKMQPARRRASYYTPAYYPAKMTVSGKVIEFIDGDEKSQLEFN